LKQTQPPQTSSEPLISARPKQNAKVYVTPTWIVAILTSTSGSAQKKSNTIS